MSIENLDRLFNPNRIAVVGASPTVGKVGHTVMHNLITAGFPGDIYPINPKHKTLMERQAFTAISDVPQVPDLAIIATPASTTLELVDACGSMGVKAMMLLNAGFAETGASGRNLEARVRERAANYPGLRLLGPNCLGLIVPDNKLNASFAAATPESGHVAFVSQSGALCTSVLDWAMEHHIGFSHFISIGNMLDVNFADLIDYLGQSEKVRAIMLYIESIKDSRGFMSAARAFARNKPIIAYKAGRFAESASAAASHTGALTGEDDVFDAAFQRAGIERVFTLDDMFECAELLARHGRPHGTGRLAILTNAGGPGVMATDALLSRKGRLAELAPKTIEKLNKVLPEFWSHRNPIDIIGDATPQRYADAAEVLAKDPEIDAMLVLLTPQSMTDPTACAKAVAEVSKKTSKPILAVWMGGESVKAGSKLLDAAGIATFDSPDRAINAFMHLVSYARNIETLYETPREITTLFDLQLSTHRRLADDVVKRGSGQVGELDSKKLLEAYRIPTPRSFHARTAEEAIKSARRIGYPVVLKIDCEGITHKSDVGGVMLNLADDAAVRNAFDQIISRAKEALGDPKPFPGGVSVQPMIRMSHPVEMILGAKRDATFGMAILIGSGGVTTEIDMDHALALPPLNERLASRMLQSLRCWPLLKGYRDRPTLAIDKLLETIVRFSYLVADHPSIVEFDINPLVVSKEGVMALDARMTLDAHHPITPDRPYAHLAIRPYPESFIRAVMLNDGTSVTLRPIRPEDEPMWHEMLDNCSAETIHSRFFSIIKVFTHEMASRYCCIDYDREMAIVAETTSETGKRLVGVGRLICDPDRQSAEYAVLVNDRYTGRGLGLLLTDFCIEIAEKWGLKKLYAITHDNNHRMIAVLQDYHFDFDYQREEGIVQATKLLDGNVSRGLQSL